MRDIDSFMTDDKPDCEKIAKNIGGLIALRSKVDDCIVELIVAIGSDEFKKKIVIPFGGKNLEIELWKILMQWFNHQTYHRGQLSIHFDLLGIDNDYSLILDKI